jgi:SAM-dependent methyltransferase
MKSSSLLVDLFGFPATLVHGDAMVLDRWRWLCSHLPRTRNGERLLEVGCGSGAFTIGAACRGYQSLGISWDEPGVTKASHRAAASGVAETAKFEVGDARELDQRKDLVGQFDVVVCCETIEHILDDLRLMRALHGCLKPGGRLLLTAPKRYSRAVTPSDDGPFCQTETGWHVRRGYSPAMLGELCRETGLEAEDVSYCSGWLSQKMTWLWRMAGRLGTPVAWLSLLPLRPLPLLLDRPIGWLKPWPGFSICLVAYRPRFPRAAETDVNNSVQRGMRAV